jgi:hypothetical protein
MVAITTRLAKLKIVRLRLVIGKAILFYFFDPSPDGLAIWKMHAVSDDFPLHLMIERHRDVYKDPV